MEDSRETILEFISKCYLVPYCRTFGYPWLTDIFKISIHGFHVKEMALMYGIPERIFYRRLKENGISLKDKYSNITHAELEERVKTSQLRTI